LARPIIHRAPHRFGHVVRVRNRFRLIEARKDALYKVGMGLVVEALHA
jgi:hypothetical protein